MWCLSVINRVITYSFLILILYVIVFQRKFFTINYNFSDEDKAYTFTTKESNLPETIQFEFPDDCPKDSISDFFYFFTDYSEL